MKKIAIFVLAAVLLLMLAACGGSDAAPQTRIGTSSLSIILPEGYVMGEDDLSEDQLAYYYRDDESIDFDVFQWAKEGIYTLEEEAEYFAGLYGAVPEPVEINGVKGMKYVTEEEFDGSVYTVVNYMLEDEKNIVELCFWTIGTEEEFAAVDEIINTMSKD